MYHFKNRLINTDKKVHVYRNLHKGGFSIKQRGLVVSHADCVLLNDASFVVNENGRQWVIHNKTKIVHAYAVGIISKDEISIKGFTQAFYNPYKGKNLLNINGELITQKFNRILLTNGKMFIG